jgi:RND family efflux transporter MFP subunit
MPDTFADTLPCAADRLDPSDTLPAMTTDRHDASSQDGGLDDPEQHVRRPRGLWVFGLGALTVAACAAVYGVIDRSRSEDRLVQVTAQEATPVVDVIHPLAGAGMVQMALPATVDAYFNAPIYARVSGYLNMWYHDIGARVTKGELLATIATPDLDQELAQAKADLAVANANYQLANVTARRWQKLLKSDAVSVQDVDVKTGDATAKLASVGAAQANVARLDALEAFKRIVAPFNGVITARKTDVGALIDSGSGAGPELFAVADIHKMRVYVRVPQAQSAAITIGMHAALSLPQYPGRRFAATVDTTAGSIDPKSNTMLVELIADNHDGLLSPGTFATVDFDLPPTPGVVRIPTSALLFREGGLKVATVSREGRAIIRTVQPGRDLGSEIEVQSGLATSDRVIDSPPDSLTDGQAVRMALTTIANAQPVTHGMQN